MVLISDSIYLLSVPQGDHPTSGMSRSQCRTMAERMLQEALPLDNQLGSLVSRRLSSNDVQLLSQLRSV